MALDILSKVDLFLLVAFVIFVSVFLYTRKHGLKREGLLFLYRTSWGIKLINRIGNKYKRTLKVLSAVSIFCGYILMAASFYLVYSILKVYLFEPQVVRAIKVPPILPLVPYLPQAFNLDFLPPFYFTYWIVILAVIAITHEMAHGIFAVYDKIKVKTTGFGFFPFFLPIFLAAFVELDEKIMAKKKRYSQMAVLSAGTFANVLTAILFFIVLWIFFSFAFVPSGIVFDNYATSLIPISSIAMVGGITTENVDYDSLSLALNSNFLTEIKVENKTYLINKVMLDSQKESVQVNGVLFAYDSAPAIKNNLSSTIIEIDGVPVRSVDELSQTLSRYEVGEAVTITMKLNDGIYAKRVTLEEHPSKPGTPWLGIGFLDAERSGFMGKIINKMASFKERGVYYEPRFDGASVFIYHLIWWMILISVSVAIMNMLPVGLFDGGRFFYLTVLSITGSEKIARKAFAFTTYLFLVALLLLMIFYVVSFLR